jgi:uncharacterized membrane protein YozB (DUF420 family)
VIAHLHPFFNACLNALSAVLLVLGWRAIKAGRRRAHPRFMVGAFAASGTFLVSYVVRFALGGRTPFNGAGALLYCYYGILFSHMVLAVVVLPLSVRTLWLGAKHRFDRHKPLARVTLPLWLYTSVTGVVVYCLLYVWPGRPAS